MCLPGTIEAVREQEGAVSRRAVLAGGGAAALAALLPGEAAAHGRRGRRHKHGHGHHHHRGRVADLTHTFTTDFPTYTGSVTSRQTVVTIPANGFYAQRWAFDEHTAHAPGRARPLHRRRSPDAAAHARGARAPDRRDRHLAPRRERPRRGGHRRGPPALRAPPRADPEERARGDVLRLGGEARDAGVPRPRLGRDVPLPRLQRSTPSSTCSTASAASAIGVDTISLDPGNSATFPVHVNWLAADHYGIEGLAGLDEIPRSGAVATVGVIPWQEGSGGPARVLATY